MGFRMSWLGVRGLLPEQVHRRLGYFPSSRTSAWPEFPVAGYDRGNGWYIVWLDECIHPLNRKAALHTLSQGATVLITQVLESSMVSSIFSYVDGDKVWDITHEAEKGLWHLDVEGIPTQPFTTVRDKMLRLQRDSGGESADVDYMFEIPIVLGKKLSGFQHNSFDPKEESWIWTELRSTN